MNNSIRLRVLTSLAALALFTMSVPAQSQRRTFTPKVVSSSSSVIVEGRVVAVTDEMVSIKTAKGRRHDFQLDGQTTLFESNDLVSIATIADITLSASDLRTSDYIEVVFERGEESNIARIITRISHGRPVARR